MTLKEYMQTIPMPQREAFAISCGTTLNYLNMIRCGKKVASEKLCMQLEEKSGGVLRCEQFRPDVNWAYIRATGCDCKAA